MKTLSARAKNFDLQPTATALFQTIAQLEPFAYGAEYLAGLLQGQVVGTPRHPDHSQLPTFGQFADVYRSQLVQGILYLEQTGYLRIRDARWGTYALTAAGRAFLDDPNPIEVPTRILRMSEYDRLFSAELRELRRSLAAKAGIPPYTIFTNYAMRSIVARRPQDFADLQHLAGLSSEQAESYGYTILQAGSRVEATMRQRRKDRRLRQADNPSHQSVKALFEAGHSLEEIAEKRKLKVGTVSRYLETLHLAGKIDLRGWVKAQVAPPDFDRAVSFFQKTDEPGLKNAYETLGLDYDTLRMCRLYVAKVQQEQLDLPLAG